MTRKEAIQQLDGLLWYNRDMAVIPKDLEAVKVAISDMKTLWL